MRRGGVLSFLIARKTMRLSDLERRLAMRGKILIFVILLFVSPVSGFAEETFTVSGEVVYSGDLDVYVSLLDLEAFTNHKKERPPAPFTQVFKDSPERKKTGRIPFMFQEVPKNSYCIIVFKDKNKNEKMDYDGWNFPQEPETSYKESLSFNWYNIKFQVDKDMTDILIPFQ